MAARKKAEAPTINVPAHIAIIMDGNGRWAEKRFLAKAAGHRAGAQALRKLADEAEKIGVRYLTVYAFSTENWSRPPEEVNTLMDLLREYIQQYIRDAKKNDMRISMIGDRAGLAPDLQRKMQEVTELTREKKGLRVIFALNYGGRDEIVRAARKLAASVKAGDLAPENVSEKIFASFLDTTDIPDPDLLIRTSGEMRISNFLLWQAAYAEIYFTEKLWPDFSIKDLKLAIESFQHRERRYGGRS
jgi:undecaprenyl diphosphate synthase